MEPAATNASIRKGDQVRVMTGRDQGKTGRVLGVDPSQAHGHRRARQHHQAAHARQPFQERQGRHRGKGRPDSDFQRPAALPVLQQAHARGAQGAARRHQGARLPPLRHDAGEIGGDRMKPIARQISQRSGSGADEALRIQEPHGRAQGGQSGGQHRPGRGQPERQAAGRGGHRTGPDCRPARR